MVRQEVSAMFEDVREHFERVDVDGPAGVRDLEEQLSDELRPFELDEEATHSGADLFPRERLSELGEEHHQMARGDERAHRRDLGCGQRFVADPPFTEELAIRAAALLWVAIDRRRERWRNRELL